MSAAERLQLMQSLKLSAVAARPPAAPPLTAVPKSAALHAPTPTATPMRMPTPTPVAAPAPKPPQSANEPIRLVNSTRLFGLLSILLLVAGFVLPTEDYLTPQRGAGYALGIVGGSLMLLLLLYSARKRVTWLNFLGSVAGWFRGHMVLGILGPLCILYHANFKLGATNSNVALFCMLTVAGSGLIGRYLYTRIQYDPYKRLFALWHALHMPLMFMLLIAGIVHVVAVHVY